MLLDLFYKLNAIQINTIQKIINADKKIADTNGLVKKRDHDTKITEIESKTHIFSGLATSAALTAVENKIPDISSLVKKHRI